jgi:hypothetical protein
LNRDITLAALNSNFVGSKDYNYCVVQLRNFVCLGIALIVLSVPVLACALPGQQMSEEEQTCCLHMADECGNSQMESHSCCTKLPLMGANVLQVTNKYAPITLGFAVQVAPDLQQNVPDIVAAVLPHVITSPESPPGQPSVLRI